MDFEHILVLLQVCEKTIQWPRLKLIHDAAMAELEDYAVPQDIKTEEDAEKAAEEDNGRRV